MSARQALLVVLAIVLGVLLTTWPLALDPTGSLLGTPGLETVDHLWTLWAALRDGPLVIDTDLVGWPERYSWVLADPANLPFFALGEWIGGPALGFNLVHVANLAIAALGAVAIGRAFLPSEHRAPALTALIAVTLPTVAGGLFTGVTEGQTLGWAALAVAALHRALQPGASWRRAGLAAALIGLCAWAGAYTAFYVALAAIPVVGAALVAAGRQGVRATGARLGRTATIGTTALGIASPVLWAIATMRDTTLAGSHSLTKAILAAPALPQHRMLGADPVRYLLPLHSPVDTDVLPVYLGAGVCLFAVAGLARRGAPWVLAACAGLLLLLGLGIPLQVGGDLVIGPAGEPVLAPAGWLSVAIPLLGRMPRWYRAAALGSLLLAPIAASGCRRLVERLPGSARLPAFGVAAVVILADGLLLAPLPWPRDTFAARPPDGLTQLSGTGPIIEVPFVPTASRVRPGRPAAASAGGMRIPDEPVRRPALLWQTFHHHPLVENPHRPSSPKARNKATREVDRLEQAAVSGDSERVLAATRTLAHQGFTWLVNDASRSTPELTAALVVALGPPEVDTAEIKAWPLGGGDPPSRLDR